jgi:hypothetical protein
MDQWVFTWIWLNVDCKRSNTKMNKILLAVAINMVALSFVYAHPGRTNASGCHNDRSNGTYHCHNSGGAAPRAPAAPSAPRAPSAPAVPSAPQNGVYYSNCAQARAAGVTPLRRGQAGYGTHLDRDNDGVACE